MLKAVRFDDNEHKQLLDFIQAYHDSKGRINESEGIRFLMQLGLESLQSPKEDKKNIDIDSLKKELYNELLQQMNNQTFNLLLEKLDKIQPVYIQNPPNNIQNNNTITQENVNNTNKSLDSQKTKIPGNSSTLLSNLIQNSNK